MVSGLVAKEMAGPGVIVSFIIAAVASILSGKCLGAEEGPRKVCLPACYRSPYSARVFSGEILVVSVVERWTPCSFFVLTAREFKDRFWLNCGSFPFLWFFNINNYSDAQPSANFSFPVMS